MRGLGFMSRLIARIKDLLRNEKNVIEIELLEGGIKISSLEVAGELEVSENGSLGDYLTARIGGMIAEHKPYVELIDSKIVDSNNVLAFSIPSNYRNVTGIYYLKVPAPSSLGMGHDCIIEIPYLSSQDYQSVVGVIWDSSDAKSVVYLTINLTNLANGTILISSGDLSHKLKEGALCSLSFMPVEYNTGG